MEKLARAFEALKSHQQGSSSDTVDSKKSQLSKKEYIQHLSIVADGICASNFKTVADFPKFLAISFELIFVACNNENSDIRLKAEECLNKIIKASLDTSLSRTQLELYKEIKKNGPSKSLRAALWRFAEVASFIRPQKCRPYIINLLPCIAKISRREEDAIQEALASFTEKVLPVLGSFLTDTEVKNLMKVLYPNLKSPSAATRRSAAKILVLICHHGRKTSTYFSMLVQTLLMICVPVTPNLSSHMCLGLLQCLRNALPYLTETGNLDQGLRGSIGVVKAEEKAEVTTKQLVQVKPNTSQVFSLDSGLDDDQVSLNTSLASKSELSSTANLSDVGLETPDTSTLSSYQDSLLESDLGESSSEQGDIITADEVDEYSNVNIGTEEEIGHSDEIDVSKGLTYMEKERKSVTDGEEEEEASPEKEEEADVDEKEEREANQDDEILEGDIGCYTDEEIPLRHLMRLLTSSFLLTGEKGCLIRDRRVRVSVKTLAMSCISNIAGMVPELFFIQLFKSSIKEKRVADQYVRDVLLYCEHSDHQLRSQTAIIIGHFIHAALRKSHCQFDTWSLDTAQQTESEPFHLSTLVTMLRNSLKDESSMTIRFTCQAVKVCIADLCMSSYDYLGAQLTYDLLEVGKSSYWLLQVELLDVIGGLNFRLLNFIETQEKLYSNHLVKSQRIQEALLEDVVMTLLGSDDLRVRTKAAETIIKIIPKLYFPDDVAHSDSVAAVAKEDQTGARRYHLGSTKLQPATHSHHEGSLTLSRRPGRRRA
ncbi:huntingtin [Apostichopus japonicus]|uniref:Huntingtin n=1 Tax=Stichopus japonicus TaxID=307972 RepID=A0A2G8K7Y2_STIJA|nr:huntingtin [Apostichopus japonicus]